MLELGLGDQVRGFVVQLPEHAQGTHIGLLGALAEAIELLGIGSFLLPVGLHGGSLLSWMQSMVAGCDPH